MDEIGPLDDLDAALARSRRKHQPIFLYWGTKWCPPCAEMQMTVLQRRSFLSRNAGMIAVAVDGDAPGAQACGERIDSEVYPTMLVLGEDEREWIRMPCGLRDETFCAVLDAALRRRTPMAQLAETLQHQSLGLHDDDLTLLASHYWPQDRRVRPAAERLGFLERLDAAAAKRRAETAQRALVWRLVEHASRPGEATAPALRDRLHERFVELLDSREATFSMLYYLLVGLEPVVSLLCDNDDTRRRDLIETLTRVLERLVDDETLTWTERLIAQSARIGIAAKPNEPESPLSLRERTQTLVAKAEAATASETERQSVMNMAGHLLRQAGLHSEAVRVFRTAVDRSPWPTYFMPYLAEMYMEQDEREEALRWWQRSYEETTGRATRFELGVRYVVALVRHAPKDRATIEGMVTRLFADRGDDADMARGRMRKSLGLLSRTLGSWRA
jgi:Thioredoxin-like